MQMHTRAVILLKKNMRCRGRAQFGVRRCHSARALVIRDVTQRISVTSKIARFGCTEHGERGESRVAILLELILLYKEQSENIILYDARPTRVTHRT